MNRNPVSVERIAEEILDGRMDATGTARRPQAWKTGLSMKELRYKMTVAIVEDKMSCARTAEKFDVSKGFVFKWSRIYKPKFLNSECKNHKVPTSVFNSIPTRLKKIIKKFRQKAREVIIELQHKRVPGVRLLEVPEKIVGETRDLHGLLYHRQDTAPERSPRRPFWRRRDETYGRFGRTPSFDLFQINYKMWPSGVHSIWVLDDHLRCILAYPVSDR